MIRSISSKTLTAAIALLMASSTAFADVTVSGVTYEFNDKGEYEPLGGVEIQAYRNGAAIRLKPVYSDDKTGKFSFTVKEGEPFDVFFYGAKRVPELTSIAGNTGGKNVINIALYTPAQYEKTAKSKQLPLRNKIDCVLSQLPNDDPTVRKAKEGF